MAIYTDSTNNITFNNVQGFDTLLFLQDLKAEILSRPGAQSNVKNTHVVLNNIFAAKLLFFFIYH